MQGQHTFKVDKAQLVSILKGNRNKHVEEYQKNAEAYLEAAKKALEERLVKARAGKKVSLSFNLRRPRSYADTYDRVIGLLELCQDTQIDLSIRDYEQFVQDEWEWSGEHRTTSMSYGNEVNVVGRRRDEDDDA